MVKVHNNIKSNSFNRKDRIINYLIRLKYLNIFHFEFDQEFQKLIIANELY